MNASLLTSILALTGCSGSGPPAPTADAGPAVAPTLSAQVVNEAFAEVPVRVQVTSTPGDDVTLTSAAAGLLARARVGRQGTVMMAWTPTVAGTETVRVRTDTQEVALKVRVDQASGVMIPQSAQGRVSRVFSAGGQREFLTCRGRGGPTTILIAGIWGWSKDWSQQVPALRRGGRVCSYDRPGLGASPARMGTRDVDAGVHARELSALLSRAGEIPPYLVVGHSYGGLVAQAFAGQDPQAVQGMVLLDPVPVDFANAWPEFGSTRSEGAPESTLNLVRSSVAAASARPLTGMPFILVTAGVAPSWLSATGFAAWTHVHERQAAGCLDCLHWTATGADHQLQQSAPDLTLHAIETVRTAMREHRPLKEYPQ